MNRHCDGKLPYISRAAAQAALTQAFGKTDQPVVVVACGRHFHLVAREDTGHVVGAP